MAIKTVAMFTLRFKSLWKMVHLRMIYRKMYLLKVTMLIFMWFDDDYTSWYHHHTFIKFHKYIYMSVWYLNISWLIHHIMVWEYVQIWYVLPMFVGSTQIRCWKNPVNVWIGEDGKTWRFLEPMPNLGDPANIYTLLYLYTICPCNYISIPGWLF